MLGEVEDSDAVGVVRITSRPIQIGNPAVEFPPTLLEIWDGQINFLRWGLTPLYLKFVL